VIPVEFELAGKLCLVTGASGFVGARVASRLLAEGARVRAFVRTAAKAEPLAQAGAEIFLGDMTKPETVAPAVAGCRVVFHLAGALSEYRPISYYRDVNVGGTRALAEAAISAEVERFVHISTVAVYGLDAGTGIDEGSKRRKSGSHYADTKLEGEEVIRQLTAERGLPAIVVQPAEIYGPEDPNWTLRPLELIRSGRMILINGGRGSIQPIYVDDVVEGILAAARRGRTGEAYILAGNEVVTLRDYFVGLAHAVGKDHMRSIPAWLALRLARTCELVAAVSRTAPVFTRQEVRLMLLDATYDAGKARRELGFEPTVSLDAGVGRVREWLAASSAHGGPVDPKS